jgi:galactoside O-acetyltransferase
MSSSFYSREELQDLGLRSFGENVLISKKASLYGSECISVGNNVRIDDFCILSGRIEIGNYVHIAAFCALYGAEGIIMRDFSGLSANVIIYSASDDFSGDYMVGAMVPREFTNVTGGTVLLDRYVQVGAGCIILPNVTLEEGVSVGAMSLVTKSLRSWSINIGVPARFYKERKKNLLELANKL